MANLARRARKATGLSQAAFGRLINVSQGQVSRWESDGATMHSATISLMLLIEREPKVCVKVLSVSRGVMAEDLDAERPIFRGDGGPPRGYQPERALDPFDGVPDYTPDFGFVGGQEEPGDVPGGSDEECLGVPTYSPEPLPEE